MLVRLLPAIPTIVSYWASLLVWLSLYSSTQQQIAFRYTAYLLVSHIPYDSIYLLRVALRALSCLGFTASN